MKNTLKTLWIFGGFLLLTPLTMYGQQTVASDDTLTIQECIDIAMENKVTIDIARQRRQSAQANEKSAFGEYLPSVNASLGGSRSISKGFDYGVQFQSPVEVTRDYYDMGLSLRQTIYNGGNVRNNYKMATLASEQAQLRVKSAKENLVVDVTTAYLNVLRARELVTVYERTLESSQAQVEQTEERYRLGAVAQSDVYKAKTQAGNDRINLLNQQQQLSNAKRELNVAMGRRASAPVILGVFEYESPEIPALDVAMQQAQASNKQIRQLELEQRRSKANLAVARSNLLPSVAGSFSYGRSGDAIDKLYTDFSKGYNYRIGVNVSIPIFNQFRTDGFVQQRRADYVIAQKDYSDAVLTLNMRVENLIEQLKTYGEVIELNEVSLQSAQEDLRLARERYNIGQATLLDVLDAQAAITRARQMLIYTKFEAKTVETQLQRLTGQLVTG
ncbi:MAG: TolC family protein [Candidatus Marinimicrobia bacterium]|nr:TolC family protein [Candidatus Neomarinimicrobiota bacterium]MCF7829521.1 TolC family protein [Candidatus Neomarinimicrobiota bacterium]MCF7880081.1 TolC family protein [Candidatus Neomarinimicrobiota bacterium]